MENMDLQPEDVRVPSGDSSPTQVPPDDSLSPPDPPADSTPPPDPALLPSIPRSENQYNEDYTDYARQIHNSTHGAWPVADGLVADVTKHAIGSIAPGSTTRPFPGITVTLPTTNLQPATSSTTIPLPNGP